MNPFVFAEVVKGKTFTDRETELQELMGDMANGQNVLLFSPRRYGKTSLVLKALGQLKNRGYVTAYVDLYRISTRESLGTAYASAITNATASKIDDALAFVKKNFLAIIPKVKFKGPGGVGVELEFDSPKKDIDRWLEGIYELPQKMAVKGKKRWVVVMDEFQEASLISPKGCVERILRSVIQHHDRVSYIFMGSKRHLLHDIFMDVDRPLYKIAKSMPLKKIPDDEWFKFIHARFKTGDISVAKERVREILKNSESHPYFTQRLCYEVFELMKGAHRDVVEISDINEALDRCVKSQTYAFSVILDNCNVNQRQFLAALAEHGNASVFSREFINKYDFGTGAFIQRAVSGLVDKGILEKEDSVVNFSDVFFRHWLRDASF